MRFTIGNQLGIGFGTVIVLMVIGAAIAHYKVAEMKGRVEKVVDEAFPASAACDSLRNGINESLASLRGYKILGSDPEEGAHFKDERIAAWREIDTAVAELERYRTVWSSSTDITGLNKIPTLVDELREAQQKIEEIAHADENIVSYHLLLTEAAPRAEQMLDALGDIIDEESLLESTVRRKQLLSVISSAHGSLALSLASIRGYLISGDEKFKQKFEESWERYQQARRDAYRLIRRMTDKQREQWDRFSRIAKEFEPLPARMLELRAADDWNQANYLMRYQAAPRAAEIMEALKRLQTSARQRVRQDRQLLADASGALTTTLTLATLLAVGLGAILSIWIGRRIISTITRAIDLIASTSSEMVQTVDKQETMAQEQAAALNEITTTIEQLARSADLSASQAGDVLDGANRVLDTAEKGNSAVQQSRDDMSGLQMKVEDVAKHIIHLSDQTSKIGNITDVVGNLAKQTNMLALNASVEAAHAGEHGKGFAVVATEIRKLADQSAESANRIQKVIDEIQDSTNATVMATDEGTKTVHSGMQLSQNTSEAFFEVTSSIRGAVERVQQISLNAKEQASAINHIGAAMDQINSGAHDSASQVVKTKAVIKHLNQAVTGLQAVV